MTTIKTALAEQSPVSTFNFRGFDLRCVEIDGQPWFAATDVCKALGIKNASKATTKLTSSEFSRAKLTSGRSRPHNVVNEAGLYKIIMRSDKPEARDFQDWVTPDVLPAIRKDGGYIDGEEKVATGDMSEDELVFKAMEVMRNKIDRLSAERDALLSPLKNDSLRAIFDCPV